MKSALTVVLFRLFTMGVFVDGNEESVSVTEGNSVTLKSGVTEIQTDDEIEWRFSGSKIATISRDDGGISLWFKPDGSFRDRLQLNNQTGDLKISNIRTTDSGKYKPKISSPRGSPEMTFTVKVVPAVVSADEVKSVMEGDSVTLYPGLTDIQRDAVLQWRYDHQKSPVAEINRKAGIFNTYDGPDGRFRGRLKLDQTGSLIITDTRTTDSGLYEVEIISTSSRYTIHHTQSFTVTVSDDVQSVSVLEGDSVTLHTGLTKIQTDDQKVWKFGDDGEIIAHLNNTVNKKWSNTDLNLQTGDLTIRNIQRDQSGLYKVEINTRTMILHRKYRITIIDAVTSVKEGESVTLPITEIQNDDQILWMFGDIDLAEINKAEQRFYVYAGPDKRFRNRLQLDPQTGSLIITDTRTREFGEYRLKISSSRRTINRRITVTVSVSGRSDPDSVSGHSDSDSVSGRSDSDSVSGRSDSDSVSGHSDSDSGSGVPPATVAWIGVFVFLLGAAVAVVVVVMYNHCKFPGQKRKNSEVIYIKEHTPSEDNGEVESLYKKMEELRKNESPPSGEYVDVNSEVIQMPKQPLKRQPAGEYVDVNSEVIQMPKQPLKRQPAGEYEDANSEVIYIKEHTPSEDNGEVESLYKKMDELRKNESPPCKSAGSGPFLKTEDSTGNEENEYDSP